MTKLLTLHLSANKVADKSALGGMSTLDLFYHLDIKISDIAVLGNQKKIKFINLISHPVTYLSLLNLVTLCFVSISTVSHETGKFM
ncbi:MAG: hypothetical protein ACOVS5_11870 [Oligoflexus sp.]|jgi:hypothetical protein